MTPLDLQEVPDRKMTIILENDEFKFAKTIFGNLQIIDKISGAVLKVPAEGVTSYWQLQKQSYRTFGEYPSRDIQVQFIADALAIMGKAKACERFLHAEGMTISDWQAWHALGSQFAPMH